MLLRLRHISASTTATAALMIHWNTHASCSVPPKYRTSAKMLCILPQVALPSVRKACENIGIQWKNACQLSVPKASHDANAIAAATTPAVQNTVHCEAAISTRGNSSPYCGL